MLKKAEVLEILENGGHITINEIYRSAYVYYEDCSDTAGACRYDTAERIEKTAGFITERGDAWSFTRRIKKAPAHYWEELSARVEKEACAALARVFAAEEEAPALEAAQEAPAEADPQNARPVKVYSNERTDEATERASVALSWHRNGDAVRVDTRDAYWGELLRSVTIQGARQERPREKDENRAHCEHIARELDAYVNGEVRRCPDCGEIHRRDWDEVGEVFRCPECGEVSSVDAWETLGIYDVLADVYDIEYRTSGRARDALRSVCVMVACGGPNIYLDTASKNVELYWWSERAWYPMSYEAVEALDEWAEEMWCCL